MGLEGCLHQLRIIDVPSQKVVHLATQLVFQELMQLFHRLFPALMVFLRQLIMQYIHLSLLGFSYLSTVALVTSAVEEAGLVMMAAADPTLPRRSHIY